MQVIEQDGKYHVVFDSREEAELHAEALKTQASAVKAHMTIAQSVENLIGHLKHFGIHAGGKAPEAAKEVPLSASHPSGGTIAAPEGEATPGPVVTRLVPVDIEPEVPDADEHAAALAAAEVK